MPVTTIIVNAALFQCAWFACVLGAAHGMPWAGVCAVALVVGWHLARAARPLPELALVGVALLIGAVFETLLVQSGWVRFDTGMPSAGTAPLWMVALWANFATTLNVSLRPLRGRPVLSALVGAIGAPVAYSAGDALGALEFRETGPALTAIAAGWLVLTPLLLAGARRLDGYATR